METLYNGIVLPDEWPPRHRHPASTEPPDMPWSRHPPATIPIDVGRQLFVDDFLVESTSMQRVYHAAKTHPAAPVLVPETVLERNGGQCPVAAPFNDGVWYDPADAKFKMWYMAGWFDGTAYAESGDGIHWTRPVLDVQAGSNRVLPVMPPSRRDGGCVWLDHAAADPARRFKMFVYWRHFRDKRYRGARASSGRLYTSPDGIHWQCRGAASPCGDNTTFFYNPFRRRWVFSLRQERTPEGGRARSYFEHEHFEGAARWPDGGPVFWMRADRLDRPDPGLGDEPQLYDVNVVAYESIMVSLQALLYGHQNEVCKLNGNPKVNDLQVGFSRDGFHFARPWRQPLMAASRRVDTWNRGYLHAAGGLFLVVDDKLFFYHGAWSGISPRLRPGEMGDHDGAWRMYAGGSTGLAVLRRDGFASMRAGAAETTLLTRPLQFSGRHLFVNVDAPRGMLAVEICSPAGTPLPGYRRSDCQPLVANSTRAPVCWSHGRDLGRWSGQPVRLRFFLRCGDLYAFWVSASTAGASNGYVAAGGPGFDGPRDV